MRPDPEVGSDSVLLSAHSALKSNYLLTPLLQTAVDEGRGKARPANIWQEQETCPGINLIEPWDCHGSCQE